MSSTSKPFGLRPAYNPSGTTRPAAYTIATGYASNILQNQPVKLGADGTVQAAAIGDDFVGSFQGVEFTDSDGRRRVSNKWTASTAGSDIVAYITVDPSIVYEISDIGSQADFTTIGSGSTTTGLSGMMLDVATLTNVGNASLRILDIAPGPDNAAGDAYTVVQVQIAEHQNVADKAAY
jgi:hypothetical protein